MNLRRLVQLTLFLCGTILHATGSPQVDPRPVLAASVPPQAWLLQELIGDEAEVLSMIRAGQDAHSYDPSPREQARLSSAQIIFTTGLEFEARIIPVLKRNNPNLITHDLRQGIHLRAAEEQDHEEEDEHHHGPTDPHIWLGPEEVLIQIRSMEAVLIRSFPHLMEEIGKRRLNLEARVLQLGSELQSLLGGFRGEAVLVYHPSFGYFLDNFGITQIAIERGGKEPSPRGLEASLARAHELGITKVLAQKEYETGAARAIAQAMGGEVIPVSDLEADWPQLMRSLGLAVRAALE